MKTKYLLIIGILLLTGCATSSGIKYSASTIIAKADMGIVVFYRPHQFGGGMDFRWGINANDEEITALGDNTYSVVKLPAGYYKFNARTSRIDLVENIEIKAGIVQYIRVVQKGFSYGTTIRLTETDAASAMPELQELTLQINEEEWAKKAAY